MNTHLFSPHTIAAGAACRGINHVLGSEPWASAELAKHASKTILLKMPFGELAFKITSAGLLDALQELDSPTLS
jgi:ubiquinone biosynthesis protein UbiJ